MNIQTLFEENRRAKGKLISIVLPVYNEAPCLPTLIAEFYDYLGTHLKEYQFEISFIDDRSTDSSFEIIKTLAENSPANIRVCVMRLSKNSGSHIAITAGLNLSRGDFTIIMASDGQDPVAAVSNLIQGWNEGYEIVMAAREKNLDHNMLGRLLSKVAIKIMIWSTKIQMPENGCDFLGLDKKVLRAFNGMRERNTTFIFRIYSLGFRQKHITYIKRARFAGKSHWSFFGKISVMLDAITGYSNRPLRLITNLGTCLFLLLFLRWLNVIFKIYALGEAPTELTIILNSLFTSLSVVVFLLGMISDYIWRILDETRKRPIYEISEVEGRIFE